jgi:hypothetical protein
MNPFIDRELWTHFIRLLDYALLPLYLMLVYLIALRIRDRYYPIGHVWRKFFIIGFNAKIFGAMFIGLIYQYYYKGGDTSVYFFHANVINQSLNESIPKWINLILHIPAPYDINYYNYTSQMMWYKDPSSYMVSCITAIISLFTFNTFLPSSILFAALSFSGNWAMFRIFSLQYPKLTKNIAITTLLIPSTFIWGSGIFKDTICLSALGWMTFCTFKILIQKKFYLRYFLNICICFYLLAVIKIYILLVYIPALTIWILYTYAQKISTRLYRNSLKLFVLSIVIIGFLYITSAFGEQLGQYSLENIASTSNETRNYILQVSERNEGSGYDLGNFDPSISGMLSKFPAAVNVALFRPYFWEAKKPIVFFNAIEAFLFLFFTIKVLLKVGIKKTWRSIQRNPNIQFFLIFTVAFAFAVGISSYNFGALSRYRIICLPFYATALVLIFYEYNHYTKPFFKA